MHTREQAVQAARATLGLPYRWGGNGPDAYDCSGLACVVLGVPDQRAAQLARAFPPVGEGAPPLGALVYYGSGGVVSHVMIVAGEWAGGERWLVGACGGGPWCVDSAKAARAGACVTCRPYAGYRVAERIGWADPFTTKPEGGSDESQS